jgi:hypothetical protein
MTPIVPVEVVVIAALAFLAAAALARAYAMFGDKEEGPTLETAR